MDSSKFQISKQPLRTTDVYTLHNAQRQGQHVYAKVFYDHILDENDLRQVIQYNSEVLQDQYSTLTYKQNMLPILQTYPHSHGLIFVTPKYDARLDQYIEQRGNLQEKQVMVIAQDILKAAYGLMISGYFHRSIRPEHFILEKGHWKLESLVLDETINQKGITTEYLWSNQYQPPQAYKRNSLAEDQLDQKVGWDFGSIIIYMLLGHHALKSTTTLNKFKGEPFSFDKIGASVGQKVSPELRQILGKLCHHSQQKRMTVKQLLKSGFFSKEVAAHYIEQAPNMQSKIFVSGTSSASIIYKRPSAQCINTSDISSEYMQNEKKRVRTMSSTILKKNKIASAQQFINTIEEIIEVQNQDGSSIINKKKNQSPLKKNVNFKEIQKQSDGSFMVALSWIKNYIDKGEILTISDSKLKKVLELSEDMKQAERLLLLTKYALYFVKALDLCILTKTMNQNSEFYFFNSDTLGWNYFHGSNEYYAVRKLANFRRAEAVSELERIRSNIIFSENIILEGFNNKVRQFVKNKKQQQCTFADIKSAYREIIKKSYDLVARHYKKNKTKQWATMGMYLTFCLAIDKIYIPKDFQQNFQFYFLWKKKDPSFYVPLEDFQQYIQTADQTILLQNSIYIMSKYFEI